MHDRVCKSRRRENGFAQICSEFSVLMVFLLCSSIGEAKTGYGLDVSVSNSTMISHWSRSQSTAVLSFQFSGSCIGNGNHSRYQSINGLAGIGLKETGYTKAGKLIDKNTISLKSEYKRIYIEEHGDNESDLYTARIEEDLPTSVYSSDDIYYKGEGIRSRSYYANNGDNIHTGYYGTALTKTARFGSTYRDALILAEVTPVAVKELVLSNRTLAFRVQSKSDRYSALRFSSRDQFLQEDYLGQFNLEAKIVRNYKFNRPDIEEDGLSCCSSEDSAYNPGFAEEIFGAKP